MPSSLGRDKIRLCAGFGLGIDKIRLRAGFGLGIDKIRLCAGFGLGIRGFFNYTPTSDYTVRVMAHPNTRLWS